MEQALRRQEYIVMVGDQFVGRTRGYSGWKTRNPLTTFRHARLFKRYADAKRNCPADGVVYTVDIELHKDAQDICMCGLLVEDHNGWEGHLPMSQYDYRYRQQEEDVI